MKTYYILLFSMIILVSCSKEDASYLEDLDPDIPFYNTLEPSQTVSFQLERGGLFPDVVQTLNHITLFFPGDSAYVYNKAEYSFKRFMGIAYPKFIRKTFHDNIFILKNPIVSGSGTPDELFIWNNNRGSAEKVNIPPRVLPKIWRFENGMGLYDVLEDELVIIEPDQTQQSISFPPIVGEHGIVECYFDPEAGQYFRISVLFDEALSTYYLIKENSDGMVKDTLMQMTFDLTDVPSLTRFVWESDVSYPYYFIETDDSAENSYKNAIYMILEIIKSFLENHRKITLIDCHISIVHQKIMQFTFGVIHDWIRSIQSQRAVFDLQGSLDFKVSHPLSCHFLQRRWK